MAFKKKNTKPRIQPREKGCHFCKAKTTPNWQDSENLATFLSPRGRILGREFTNVCVKHQKRLAESIKHARHLGLLPFTTLE